MIVTCMDVALGTSQAQHASLISVLNKSSVIAFYILLEVLGRGLNH